MKLPNLLTSCRLFGAPFFLWAFLTDTTSSRWWALGIVIAFEVTDLLDGFLARQLEQTTQLGKILDPLADSISRFTVFLGFLTLGYASVWAIAAIFYRDSIVSTIRILAASQGVIVSARWSGKLKAIVQGTAIIVIMTVSCLRETLGFTDDELRSRLTQPLMWFVAAVTLMSLVDYLVGNRKILAKLDR